MLLNNPVALPGLCLSDLLQVVNQKVIFFECASHPAGQTVEPVIKGAEPKETFSQSILGDVGVVGRGCGAKVLFVASMNAGLPNSSEGGFFPNKKTASLRE